MKGHFRQRSPGRWAIVLDVNDPSTGKRRRRWHRFGGTKREAQIECARLISLMTNGDYLKPDKTTVAIYLTCWLDHVKANVAPRTHERYREIATKNIIPLLGAVKLAQLKPVQISLACTTALKSGRRDGKGGLSSRTVLHMHRVFETIPLTGGSMATSISQSHRRRRSTEGRAARDDEPNGRPARRLTRHPSFHPRAIGRSLWTSARRDLRAALARRRSGRGSIGRCRECRANDRLTGDSLVAAHPDGSPTQPTFITHEWVRVIRGTTLPRLRFHDLRHAQATHLLGSNTHPKIVSERLQAGSGLPWTFTLT
jgi:hypothetical protein